MNARELVLLCVCVLAGLAPGNAGEIPFFEDHMDGPPADNVDALAHGYGIVHNFIFSGSSTRIWSYNASYGGYPGVLLSVQSPIGTSASACIRASEVLPTRWKVYGTLAGAEREYDPNAVMEYGLGLIVSSDATLGDNWLVVRWLNFSVKAWHAAWKIGGVQGSRALSNQAPAFSGGEVATIQGNPDGTFNLLVDGIGDLNVALAGLDSRSMQRFGFSGLSANGSASYRFQYDDLVVTSVAQAGTVVLIQ